MATKESTDVPNVIPSLAQEPTSQSAEVALSATSPEEDAVSENPEVLIAEALQSIRLEVSEDSPKKKPVVRLNLQPCGGQVWQARDRGGRLIRGVLEFRGETFSILGLNIAAEDLLRQGKISGVPDKHPKNPDVEILRVDVDVHRFQMLAKQIRIHREKKEEERKPESEKRQDRWNKLKGRISSLNDYLSRKSEQYPELVEPHKKLVALGDRFIAEENGLDSETYESMFAEAEKIGHEANQAEATSLTEKFNRQIAERHLQGPTIEASENAVNAAMELLAGNPEKAGTAKQAIRAELDLIAVISRATDLIMELQAAGSETQGAETLSKDIKAAVEVVKANRSHANRAHALLDAVKPRLGFYLSMRSHADPTPATPRGKSRKEWNTEKEDKNRRRDYRR